MEQGKEGGPGERVKADGSMSTGIVIHDNTH